MASEFWANFLGCTRSKTSLFSKVSFDLTKGGDDSTTTKLDSCSIVNKDNLVVPNEDILTNISDENRDNFPCSASSGSSCHSSRCCCSSYVCSMCSPRGSLDHGIFPPDSGSSIGVNSVDITSPRIHSKSVLLQDHVEASTAVDNVQTITNLEQIGEQSHKITQTELLHYSTTNTSKKNQSPHKIFFISCYILISSLMNVLSFRGKMII